MRYKALLFMGVAVVLGAIAAYLVNSILSRQIAEQAEMKPQEVKQVVVAVIDLPVGSTLEAAHLRVVELPLDAYPEGAFTSRETLLGIEPPIVIQEIRAGEIILPHRLSSGAARRGLTVKIADGMRAVAIPVNEVRGVAGFVLPGDHVDVLHTTTIGRRDGKPVTRTLMQDAIVLGVDQISSETENDPKVVSAVTLLVAPEQAKQLTLAMRVGELTLSLRNEGDRIEEKSKTIAESDLWGYGPKDVRRPAKVRSVEIIRGLEVNRETVSGFTPVQPTVGQR